MKRTRTEVLTATLVHAASQTGGNHARREARPTSLPAAQAGEPIDLCYRAVLETSDSAILLLSPESTILEWNHAAEVLFGWTADEALGRSYVELCVAEEARKSFLAELGRVAVGAAIRKLEQPVHSRAGSQTLMSWNISPVPGAGDHLIGLMAIGTALASQLQIAEEIRLAQTQARREARLAQTAAEEERRRIARELHDEFGQGLTGLKFDLAWLEIKVSRAPSWPGRVDLAARIPTMAGSVDKLLESVRTTAASLRPAMLDDLGLIPALECLATTFQHRTGTPCAIEIAPELLSIDLSSEVSTALFRIAQESLTNTMRHASASRVQISLYRNHDTVTLEVADNGIGIRPERLTAPHSFGLRGMRERVALLGGHFHVTGTAGSGTTTRASLPLTDSSAS